MQILQGYEVLQAFWDSDETDKIIMLNPPKKLIEDVKSGKIKVTIDPIKVRLIKYKIGANTYVLLTTLLDKEKYPEEIFPSVYHSRWGVEEMLKVSKIITGVQDFHAKSENGIKQEVYAHFLMITMMKIIQSKAYENIEHKKNESKKPSMRRLRGLNDKEILSEIECKGQKIEKKEKINTKNSFLSLGRILEKFLFWDMPHFINNALTFFLESVEYIYQFTRPNRHYPRVSRKAPSKWNGTAKPAFKGS